MFKLKKKILEGNGWSVLDLDFKAFQKMVPGDREEWLMKEIENYTKKTEKAYNDYQVYRREKVMQVMEEEMESIKADEYAERKERAEKENRFAAKL